VRITGWSPFEPGHEDDASLPVAALEYELTQRGAAPLEAVFSFHAANFLAPAVPEKANGRIGSMAGGFVLEGTLHGKPWTATSLAVATDDAAVKIDHAWSRGMGPLQMVWNDIAAGGLRERAPRAADEPAGGASLYVPVSLAPGQSKTVVVRLAWYCAESNLNRPVRAGRRVGASDLFVAVRPAAIDSFLLCKRSHDRHGVSGRESSYLDR
jgi:hypothetical protein